MIFLFPTLAFFIFSHALTKHGAFIIVIVNNVKSVPEFEKRYAINQISDSGEISLIAKLFAFTHSKTHN